jgi:hypothetical protein
MKKKNMGGMTEQAGAPSPRANEGAPSFGSRRPATPASQSMPKPAMQPMTPPPAAAQAQPAMQRAPGMQGFKKGGVAKCRGMGKAKRGGSFKG